MKLLIIITFFADMSKKFQEIFDAVEIYARKYESSSDRRIFRESMQVGFRIGLCFSGL